jgi:uncharacterized protein (UPF0210 family)
VVCLRVRSLTFLIPSKFLKDFSAISGFVRDVVGEASKSFGLDVWTLRLAVDPQSFRNLPELVEFLDDVSEPFNYYAIPLMCNSSLNVDYVADLLGDFDKLFISLYGGLDQLRVFRDLLIAIRRKLPLEAFVKVSFSVGGNIITPYFPSASAGSSPMLSASLLYVKTLIEGLNNGVTMLNTILDCVKRVKGFITYLAECFKFPLVGLDLSISPWMDESVVDLLEVFGNVRFGGVGTLKSIYDVNGVLKHAASMEPSSIGFNELMLPYAEDSKLMQLGFEGKLSAYDLLRYSSICVAGFDMAVLPRMDDDLLTRFLLDVYSTLSVKGRPNGIRVVLSDGDYGDVADLGFLGKAPVMKLI